MTNNNIKIYNHKKNTHTIMKKTALGYYPTPHTTGHFHMSDDWNIIRHDDSSTNALLMNVTRRYRKPTLYRFFVTINLTKMTNLLY